MTFGNDLPMYGSVKLLFYNFGFMTDLDIGTTFIATLGKPMRVTSVVLMKGGSGISSSLALAVPVTPVSSTQTALSQRQKQIGW